MDEMGKMILFIEFNNHNMLSVASIFNVWFNYVIDVDLETENNNKSGWKKVLFKKNKLFFRKIVHLILKISHNFVYMHTCKFVRMQSRHKWTKCCVSINVPA